MGCINSFSTRDRHGGFHLLTVSPPEDSARPKERVHEGLDKSVESGAQTTSFLSLHSDFMGRANMNSAWSRYLKPNIARKPSICLSVKRGSMCRAWMPRRRHPLWLDFTSTLHAGFPLCATSLFRAPLGPLVSLTINRVCYRLGRHYKTTIFGVGS